MSSKDHGKKGSGQFFQGKTPDKGKASKPPSSQSSKKGDNRPPEKYQNQQGNKGKQESKKTHTNASQQRGESHMGESSAQKIGTLLSGLASGIQLNQATSNFQMTHISVNVHTTNTASHVNQALPNSYRSTATPTNQITNMPKKGNNPKKRDSPAELRVFTGVQETNTEKTDNFTAFRNRGRGQFNEGSYRGTHSAHNSNSRQQFNSEKHANYSATENRGRGLFNQRGRGGNFSSSENRGRGLFNLRGHRGSHGVHNFNSSQESNSERQPYISASENRGRGHYKLRGHGSFQPFQNSNRGHFWRGHANKLGGLSREQPNQSTSSNITTSKLQTITQSHKLFDNKRTQKLLINKHPPSGPFFFKTYSKENDQNTRIKSVDSNSIFKMPPAPQYKHVKKSRPHKVKSQSNLTNENQATKSKPGNLKKTRNQGRNKFKHDWSRKKKESKEVIPLFSFARNTVNEETESIDTTKINSDDEDDASESRCSSDGSVWTTNISDDEVDNSSDESEVSEFSIISSVKSSEFSEDKDSGISLGQSGIISVFWDIENCPIPREKSAVDFVKLVRTTLYEGRTERSFSVVCDVHNLSATHSDALYASDVTVFHMSSTNKNAADSKLNSLLLEFRDIYKDQTGCAVVLISGDSDFSNILNTLRFKHNIFINLICKKNARHSLIEAAHKCIFYEDFVEQLPTRSGVDDTDYLIIVSNFPKNLSAKQLKSSLNSRLKSVNCRIRKTNEFSCDIIFPDECARSKALSLLKNFKIENCEVQIACAERKKIEISNPIKKSSKSKLIKKTTLSHTNIEPTIKQQTDISDKGTVPSSKGATLCIYVAKRLGDVTHWKTELEKLWNMSDFILHWEGLSNEGCFLANFKSLNKAQKAKKILQKLQINDATSPKFLKLIKQDDILCNFSFPSNIQDINKKKVEEHLKIIESKKEISLNKHKQIVADHKTLCNSTVSGSNEAFTSKSNELNEQKVTFLNSTQEVIKKLNSLDLTSETIEKALSDVVHDFSRECNCLTSGLPIYAKKNFILKKIKKHQVVIIKAETGFGKSTQLTQYLWREKDPSQKNLIICTQPRKIAAISLAKHVSSQIGSSLGDIVGYQVGTTVKKSSNTEVLYVTDFTMLMMMVNNDLKEVSHIIVDEVHERTLYTDLFLAIIKKSLVSRPDLKLIIISANVDHAIFTNYFGIGDESILEVSGRTFPIEDIWLDHDVAVGWDYFKKTINTVCSLLGQEAGDVLAFLTSSLEVEKAVKELNDKLDSILAKRVKVFQLHENIDLQEQQKVFERTPNDMQKVVFATNYAESSVTIPGIKFVVDCGMVKVSEFNAARNMTVMSVNFVSQSAAEQRRGRAGRTQIGKCYRLYSKKNYEQMKKNSEPEILSVNLGTALLKLMKLGIEDPLKFDFVQSPPQNVLLSNMQQLLDLNAVNLFDMSLSELGEHMSYLPLEPRLSFLILAGIDLDIGFDAIALASLVTISRSIFFRIAENKLEANSKKMRFCQSESDFLTFLQVYKEWATVPKKSKSKWCVLNGINPQFLSSAHDLINEITLIVNNEINIKVPNKFHEEPVQDSLLKLIFCSFYQNLCIFSGHYKFGYRSLGVSGDLLIHPSSSLYTYGNWRPEFLVYDSVLRTNQTYLINVSPVSKELILECMDAYGLNVNLTELETLPLAMYGISPIGKIILCDIMGKQGKHRRKLEDQIKKEIGSENTVMEVDIQKGEVKVFGPQNKYDEIAAILCPLIEEAQERLAMEEKEVFLYPEFCTIISNGIVVKEVVFPGEFRDLKVILKSDVKLPSIVEKLQSCGQVSSVSEWKNYSKVTFASPHDARLALKAYSNEHEFTLQKIVNSNIGDNRINQYKVYVSFLRRECTGEAYITTDPPCVLPESLYYLDRKLQVSNSKKTTDIRMIGLPSNTNRHDLQKFVASQLSPEIKLKKCLVVRKKEYDSTSVELQNIKLRLSQIFSEFTSQDKFTIDLKKPTSKDFSWNACIFFQNPCDGETAVNVLKNRTYIDGMTDLQITPSLQTNIYCKLEVFSAIEEQITEALNFFKSNSKPNCKLEINAVPNGENKVQINITSNNLADISEARKAILKLVLGYQIQCNSKASLMKLFSKTGEEQIKKIVGAKTKCYVELNEHKKLLSIFSNATACNSLLLEIYSFLDQLEQEISERIILMSENGKPGILRELLSKYGHDLEELKAVCGLTNIEIIFHREHVLTVWGCSTAVIKCQAIIDDIKTKLENSDYEEDTENCPVCFAKVSEKFYLLEFCGHAYCKKCILHWFQTASEFPLCCITCESPVILEDLQWATKEVESLDKEIYNKSISVFVESRKDVSYCPSPDCTMIYRISNDGTVFQCPKCNNSICTQCEELFHYGMSCDLNKLCKVDEDSNLKVWEEADPESYKICPSCSSPLEKNGASIHMICWKCKCDFCWKCLEVFPTANLVYNHQPFCPKTNV